MFFSIICLVFGALEHSAGNRIIPFVVFVILKIWSKAKCLTCPIAFCKREYF